MGSITNYLEAELLDHVLNAAWTPPSNLYLCLCTADPTDAATGASCNEVANLYAYARTEITFGAESTRKVTQDAAVNFPQASGGSWGTVSHWAIADTNTYGSGNVLAHGAFSAGKTVNDGDTPSVASGQIYVEFSANEVSNYLVNKLLDLAFNGTAYSKPDKYVALVITTPVTDSMTGSTITEPSGGSYARVQVNDNGGSSPTWDVAVEGDPSYVDNTHDITFTTATGDWGTIIAVAICDAATLGNLLFYDNDMTDKAVNNGDTAKFPLGDLDVQMS